MALSRKIYRVTQAAQRRSWRKFCDGFRDEKQLFSLFQQSRGGSSIPAFSDPDGDPCSTNSKKAQCFNDECGKIGTRSPRRHCQTTRERIRNKLRRERLHGRLRNGWCSHPAFDRATEKTNFRTAIAGVKLRSAGGIDDVSNRIIAELPKEAFDLLRELFRLCLEAGFFPSRWKDTLLFPIPKKKEVLKATDLRPISLLCNLGKLMERVLQSQLVDIIDDDLGILPKAQTAFLRREGTHIHLTTVPQRIRECINNGKFCTGLFFDIKKAYNSVWHDGLVSKLLDYGIPSAIVRFVDDWLRGRPVATRLGDSISDSIEYARGVPQGSVLSCILFNAFFSDIVNNLEGDAKLYADNLGLLYEGTPDEHDQVFNVVRRDLRRISDWCYKWQLEAEPSKTAWINFTRSRSVREIVDSVVLHFGGKRLYPPDQAKYLGIILDSKATFEAEGNRRIKAFDVRLCYLRRIAGYSWGCPVEQLRRLYVSFAIPVLLYFPWFISLAPRKILLKLQSMQCCFVKWALSLPRCSRSSTAAEVYFATPPLENRLLYHLAVHAGRIQTGIDSQTFRIPM